MLKINLMNDCRRIADKIAAVAIALGLWVALVLLFAAPLALTSNASWRRTISFGASFWLLWLLFLPAVAWVSFHLPITRKKLVRNVAIHMLLCFLVVGTNRIAFRSLERAIHRPLISRADRIGPPDALGVLLGFRAALDVLVYWSLMGVCQAITYFRMSQERGRRTAILEAKLIRAQLQALRMQLNPHFLFNTLNSISGLVYVNPRTADEMLSDLSDLLRNSLDSMDQQEIPLSQELEFIEVYLRIEQKRFGDRLRIVRDISDEARKALVPVLILQPLVENAIRHGIEPWRVPGLISIEAMLVEGQLHLIVQDNGKGCLSEKSTSSERGGIGLSNTRARLQELYGPNQTFLFKKMEPHGFRVDIQLPFRVIPNPAHPPLNNLAV